MSGPSRITIVVREGADPAAVAHRIAGPGATVAAAYPDRRPRENLPQIVIELSFVVTVPGMDPADAVARARSDPDVVFAHAGTPAGP
jgi:hypothetical protein